MDMLKNNRKWIDISVLTKNKMVSWPGDPLISITQISSIKKGDVCNLSSISMGTHSGTHIDAPFHFIQNGKTIDKLPLNRIIGTARVIKIENKKCITVEELIKNKIRKGERILFKTRNSDICWNTNKFVKDFIYISEGAAEYLANKQLKTIGVDYLSVGGFFKDGAIVHKILLKADIWLIEGLNLSKVKSGKYDLICLPVNLFNTEGAPARAIVRKKT